MRKRGFGFILPDSFQDDLFFHFSNVITNEYLKNPKGLQEGDRVSFYIEHGRKGLHAVDVEVVNEEETNRCSSEEEWEESESEEEFKLIESNATGNVKRYIVKGGYGFIAVDRYVSDAFFHRSQLVKCCSNLHEDIPKSSQRVSFRLMDGPRGYVAEEVHLCRCTHKTSAKPGASKPGNTNKTFEEERRDYSESK